MKKQEKKKILHTCDFPNCTEGAEFRAPKDRTLRSYYWFCLKHVQEYNKKWDFLEELCDISPDELTNLPGKKKMPFFIALESPDNIFFKFFQSADLTLRDKAGNSLLFPALVHDLLNGSLNRFGFLCNKGLDPNEKNLAGFSCNDMLQHYASKI